MDAIIIFVVFVAIIGLVVIFVPRDKPQSDVVIKTEEVILK